MSKNDARASEKAPDERADDSVYDFLYHDVRRVGSFLAQFDDAGHLQQITQSDTVAKSARRGWKFGLGGGMPPVGNAEASVEVGPSERGSESSARVYDPLWTNARTLLDYLSERNLIAREIHNARIGQFVLVSGGLRLIDLTILKGAWAKDAVAQYAHAGGRQLTEQQPTLSRQVRRQMERQAGKGVVAGSSEPSPVELTLQLLPLFPHAVQAIVDGRGFQVWSTLSEQNIVGLASDFVLKHGLTVAGDWHLLGVLDALPDTAAIEKTPEEATSLAGTPIGGIAAMLVAVIRQMIGRPSGAYGMTPLLIFREVSAN